MLNEAEELRPAKRSKLVADTPAQLAARQEKTQAIYGALIGEYGYRRWRRHLNPLEELIATILSQHTSDINSGRAFDNLVKTFNGDWEAVMHADTDLVAAAIKGGGLANMKAPRIQQVLKNIWQERGDFDLEFLDTLPLAEAKAWLNALDGVGPKTTACVLMFALNRPALPVDTHVHRVSLRLGLINSRLNADRAHLALEQQLQPDQVYSFHINMIMHGRKICKAQRPLCQKCVLQEWCDYYREHCY